MTTFTAWVFVKGLYMADYAQQCVCFTDLALQYKLIKVVSEIKLNGLCRTPSNLPYQPRLFDPPLEALLPDPRCYPPIS